MRLYKWTADNNALAKYGIGSANIGCNLLSALVLGWNLPVKLFDNFIIILLFFIATDRTSNEFPALHVD